MRIGIELKPVNNHPLSFSSDLRAFGERRISGQRRFAPRMIFSRTRKIFNSV